MRRDLFYKSLQRRESGAFGTSLSAGQVQGCEAILDACMAHEVELNQAAYILATAYGETGGKMQAVRENMNYSARMIAKHFKAHRRQGMSPSQLARRPQVLANTVYGGAWGAKHLGNTEPDDGWNFRGWGIGQWTGRRNTVKAGRDVGMDLISNPSNLDDPKTNAELLVRWMLGGKATGKKLSDYIQGSTKKYTLARSVWGGVDAPKYARLAEVFQAALRAGDYKAEPPAPAHPDPAEQPSGWGALIKAILSIFARKK